MKNQRNFRFINETEKKIIRDSLSKISAKVLLILNKEKFQTCINLSKLDQVRQKLSIFLIPKNLIKIIREIKYEININSAGLYFGHIKRGGFFLSLEGAEFLHDMGAFREKNLMRVTVKGEKSILYGNKILKKMIHKVSPNLKKKDFLLIFNSSGELISIGLSQVDYFTFQNLKIDELIALNLVDKGYYLRKNQ